jgi:hypothetical protein
VRCWGNGADGRLGLCAVANVGDDETPGSVARVDLGAGGAACPVSAPAPIAPTPGGAGAAESPAPAPAPPPSSDEEALRAEMTWAQGLSDCRASVLRAARRDRTRAQQRYRPGTRLRAAALRRAGRRAAQGRTTCLRRFGRIPGRTAGLAARAGSGRKIVLTFRAPGSNGSAPPAARAYLVKQSLRPIRTPQAFRRAPALCKGACTFAVTQVNALITLEVTNLRPNTTYYYSVAARDNVSKRTGPRSRTVQARIR